MQLTKVQGMNPNGTAWKPSLDELLSPKLQVVNKKEDASGTVYAKLIGDYRRNENVIEKWCFVLDIDKSSFDVGTMLTEGLQGFQGCFHTTFSHDPMHKKYCYRVILVTDSSIAPDDYGTAFLNLVDSNGTLSELRDKGVLDMTAKDKGRFFYDFSCPPDRKDDAQYFRLQGCTPLIPDTQYREEPNKPSSKVASVSADYFKEKKVYEGTGQRNSFEAREIGRLIQEGKDKEIVIREALIINETQIVPPEPAQEIIRQVNNLWDLHFKNNPEDMPVTSSPFARELIKDFKIYQPTFEDLTVAPPPRKFLIDGFIPQGIVGGVVAQGGTGKSFFALQLCSSVASGFMLYNKWTIGNVGKVVYITGEETTEEVMRRMYYLNRRLPDAVKKQIMDNMNIISFADQYYPFIGKDRDGNIVITPVVEELTSKLLMAITAPINLIFVDPISRFRDGEENDNTAGTRFVQALQQIRSGLNKDNTLLCAHHGNKGAGQGDGHHQNDSRGASSVVDGMRFMLKMSPLSQTKQKELFGTTPTQDDRYVDLAVIKTNYTKKLDPIYLKIEDEGVLTPVTKLVGLHLDIQILEEIQRSPTSKSNFTTMHGGVEGLFGLAEKVLRKKLSEMESDGLITIEPHHNMKLTKKGEMKITSGKSQAIGSE